ncbi:ROK family transcriptional regulator [Saccharopolyspora erythraea]|uniref:ROK family transcriptional regulator n=1 Tax=Saccharopolyspora erythraea TaxID=1836 RepID=UPI001BAD6CC7|nr:ROK family transcriptional regulator [Saccharopolyspora erythraea]QUH01152.1 ROK family transcriptional regulator [Saccharopolyspora erythraea]
MVAERGTRTGRDGSPRLLREINDRAAIEALLGEGPLTRAELEDVIGLSKPATASLLNRLESAGVVRRGELRGGNRGPRAQTWYVNGALAHVAGVSVTPCDVDVVISDVVGDSRVEHRAPMPAGDTDAVLSAFGDALSAATAKVGLRTEDLAHVVVGAQGAVDPATGHLGFAPHLPGWEGFDVPGRLGELLGTGVTVENDVNLVAMVEMDEGRARDVRDFVLVWLGDGVGSAVVVNRALLRGATGGAGEIDWMHVPDRAERDTGSDRRGGRFGKLVEPGAIMALARAHGLEAADGEDAIRKAASDPGAREFLNDYARRVATGLAGVVSVLDPELVLLSAGIAQAGGSALAELVAERLHELVVPRTPVETARISGNPVRAGALRVAIGLARERVFGLPTTAAGVLPASAQ